MTTKSKKPTSGKRRVNFSIDAGPGKKVSVAGTFNDWDPEAKVLKDKNNDGIYRGAMMLPPGTYEYKYVIDGVWCVDAQNQHFVPNELGTINSMLIVE